MAKGFSISISPQNIEISSFLADEYDDFYLKSDNFDFLFEGVLLNRQKLLQQFAAKDFEALIRKIYSRQNGHFFSLFEGEFRGFLFDKQRKRLLVFTNITSTQRVFYSVFNNSTFIDTDLKRLTVSLKNADFKVEPDVESLYQLVCFTSLPEEKTPVKQVKKLLDGRFLDIDISETSLLEREYFSLAKIPTFSGSKEQALERIHEVFSESVRLEYEKDCELGKNHLCLLSGGLDSRIAMFYAMKNHQKPDIALCFSQSRYFDHTISEKIAKEQQINYEFIPLDGGDFLKTIDEMVALSEGLVLYTGSIHVQHAVKNLKFGDFGLFHSGQIGDGIVGGFNSAPFRKKPSDFKLVVNRKFLPKIKNSLHETLKNYETEELFLIRNIAFNRTIFGAHVFQQKAYQTSPFMTKDFLETAISLPEKWKYNQNFYLEWLNKYCPEAAKYRWERTLLKPDARWKTKFGDRFVKRGFKILNEKVLKTPAKSSMYPYQFYYDSQPEIQRYYAEYFQNNFHRLSGFSELEKDVTELFAQRDFFSKSQAVNILAIFKLFF